MEPWREEKDMKDGVLARTVKSKNFPNLKINVDSQFYESQSVQIRVKQTKLSTKIHGN